MSNTENDPAQLLVGSLHGYIAFDWGEEIDLAHARRLAPAESRQLPRRRRTPPSVGYRPAPLRFALPPWKLTLPGLGLVQAETEATVFDFAAVSAALHVPLCVSSDALLALAGWLADPRALVQAARDAVQPLYQTLLPSIHDPLWQDDLSEEYFVFQLAPAESLGPIPHLLEAHADWLAGLVHLEAGPLSSDEVSETVRRFIRYGPDDLFLPDWAAALLIDHECDETLQTIEFANLQLLEYRHIDRRLDDNLAAAYQAIHTLAHSWLPLAGGPGRSLRQLGELKVEATGLFERTGNVLKLTGDQYLARVYRLLASRFHLRDWEAGIQRKLEAAEGVYQVAADQIGARRAEFLEIAVVVLVALEVALALFRR